MSRGNTKQKIFLADDDRRSFIDALDGVVGEFSWVCHAYCLMDNHYHLLVETPKANISEGMQRLNGNYCRGFNRKYNRIGHVTQGRFISPLVENDRYLFVLYRYILLNPVNEGLVNAPELWRWSSYAATVGLVPAPRFLEVGYTLSLFSENPGKARDAFASFISGGLEEEGWVEGSGIMLELLVKGANDKQQRMSAIRKAHMELGLSVQEIAEYLRIHPATVYRALIR